MATPFKPYPSYKNVEIDWIDSIPSEWSLGPIKYQYAVIGGSTPKSGVENYWDGDLIWVTPADLSKQLNKYVNRSLRSTTLAGLASCGTSLVPKGSVIVSTRAPIGSLAIAGSTLCTNQGCKALVPLSHRGDSRYLYYWLSVNSEHLNILGKGTTFLEISGEVLAGVKMPIPASVEQEHIANSLDHETAKVDTLIDKQQQLIKLLKEKRQAVISHAVTKGLNPDVPMKDSGVEWLGEVPEHWIVTRLKYECRHIIDCMHSTPQYDVAGEYPAIRTADISPGFLDIAGARRVSENVFHERNGRLVPKPNDIIYSREGERYGMAALVPENSEVCLAQRVMLFRAKCPRSASFMMWHLNSNAVYMQAYQDVIGATSPHINVETIKNFYMSWPPLNERQEIATYISSRLIKFDRLIEKAENKILLLQERCTALISAAVIGKIDVRN